MSRVCVLILSALLFSFATPGYAETKAGVLTCKTSASLGLIVGSHQKLQCSFAPSNGGPSERYSGVINRIGLDLGITAAGVMTWGVATSLNGLSHGALAGKYVGASADISAGLGVGANLLVGGSKKSVSLQPLSVEGQAGVNLALGVAGLTLYATR